MTYLIPFHLFIIEVSSSLNRSCKAWNLLLSDILNSMSFLVSRRKAEWCFDDPGAMGLLSYKCFSCFFEQHRPNSLCMRCIFFFATRVQQQLTSNLSFLYSFRSMGFTFSRHCHVIYPYFRNYLNSTLSFPYYVETPCIYNKSCLRF